MTIDQLSEDRKKLRQQLIDSKLMDGFKNLLTLLYSDKVHFIYELLQNAEDVGASKVQFNLSADKLEFEHNGDQLFEIEDVESITNIGSSTKVDDDRSIGEFGIGFKSVFAYTATPEIESGDFRFRIHDMFVPDTEGLPPGTLGEKRTRFIFPFNNPDKSPEEASEEIETKLRQLNENALLFLSNIRKIEYRLPNLTTGSLERREDANDGNRIEISVMRPEDIVPEPIHYLRFEKVVSVKDEDNDELKKCRIAIAFGMDKPGDNEWKIIPLNQGQVCIYFPAVKETSQLRFHLHAPFASTVARDSVRECSANDELRTHLAELIAESMHTIRDQGLLNVEFLTVLPNSRDELLSFYLPIQKRLIEEFNTEKLTPMRQGGHAAASGLYRDRGDGELSSLIQDKDLAVLLEKKSPQPLWIANLPPRKRNEKGQFIQDENEKISDFLTMLNISEWTDYDLIKIFRDQPSLAIKLLKEKPTEWHQKLYAFFGDSSYSCSDLRIVRCSDSKYRIGEDCHFPIDDVEYELQGSEAEDGHFHYIVKGVYSSGKSKNEQERSREFLEKIGVREVDEAERIKAILRQRYEDPDTEIPPKLHEEDMKRFIALVEKEPDKATLFKKYNIFNTSGGNWSTSLIFLDSPYLETGLKVCYESDEYQKFIEKENVDPCFSLDYEESNIDLKKLGKFAEILGAKTKLTKLEDVKSDTWDHPKCDEFRSEGTGVWTCTGIDIDYRIPEFKILIDCPSVAKAKLIWQAMCSVPENYLKAEFRWNQANSRQVDRSSLVYELRDKEWVPQKKNSSKISFLKPCDAYIEHLPEGFPYQTGQRWLEAIEFGAAPKEKRLENNHKEIEENQKNQKAKGFGFNSADEANTMAEIANAWKAQGKSPDELRDKLIAGKRRKERILIELEDAPEKEYEQRLRSVRSTIGTIDRRTYLRAQYTTDEDKMECQMCRQDMPFKKRNSDEDYFEAVEALKKDHFPKEHEAQHLALCPACAAKYKEFVKRDEKARAALYSLLKNSGIPEGRLQLSDLVIRIWFKEKHWQDLKTVLDYYENIYNPDESD